MTDEFMQSSASEEFDFSGDGLPEGDHVATITDFAVEEKDKGTQHVLTYESATLPFPIPVGYWVEHENPKAAQVGRSNLKKVALAALGQPKYTSATIKGAKLLIHVKEDNDGFARVSKFRPAPAEVQPVL